MKLFGKEVNPATINLYMNLVSFIIGIWFYFKIASNTKPQNQIPFVSPTYDSLRVIEARLNYEIRELKKAEETLVTQITENKKKLTEQTKEVNVHRQQIRSILNSDWNSLNRDQQDAYINHIMSNLKQATP